MLPINGMIGNVFSKFSQCYFYVRANKPSEFINVQTSKEAFPQKEILCMH
ncbi:unnamed protein product [Meloidogyne enterolobii]|uniref:Uncharacterized protein n=2 Tax=Meloidogyne enterolobii TaxID=390850 RepID=A0ACB0Z0D9_MELEN|nr:unnamed protein product [Meloidogyne enterolobii]